MSPSGEKPSSHLPDGLIPPIFAQGFVVKKALVCSLATLFLSAMSNVTLAETASSTLPVSATVINSCAVLSPGAATTISYDPTIATALTLKTSAQVRCTRGAAVTLSYDQGVHGASGSTCASPLRQAGKSNGDMLGYAILDGSTQNPWGCGPSNGVGFTADSAAPASFNVTIQVPSQQDVSPGTYTDTVTLTASF